MNTPAARAVLALALLTCSALAAGAEVQFSEHYTQMRLLEQRELLFHELPLWAVVLNLVAAATLLTLWRVRADIPHYPWLLGASLSGSAWFTDTLGLPLDPLLSHCLLTAWYYCLLRLLYPAPVGVLQRHGGVLPGAMLLAHAIAAMAGQPLLHAGVNILGALGLWLAGSGQLTQGLRRHTATQSALALAVWLMALAVLLDSMLVLGNIRLSGHPDQWLQTLAVAQMAGVLLALYFLVASHVENQQQLAALNASLDQRVQDAEAEIAERYAMLTRDALDAAALRERKAIYQSIHEDLSDKLLQLIYAAPDPATADLARAALAELRDSRKLHPEQAHALDEVLADAFAEAQTRCDQAGLALDWQTDASLQGWTLTARQESALLRTLREALSNLLKHAQARHVSVTARVTLDDSGGVLHYEVRDDGVGVTPGQHSGRGLVNMRNRLQELGGGVEIGPGSAGGTRVQFSLPLQPRPQERP